VDTIKRLLDRLGESLGRFSFNQKVLLGALLTAGVLSIAIFTLWLRHEEKVVLFTNLSADDAAVALEELTKQNVAADLTNGGTTILVPERDVHRLRVELASKGIPSSGVVGFEIFDGKQYGLTEFLQNVNFKRALEGELTKTIEGLAGITAARVHLVLPKPSIFRKLQSEPTASVVLALSRHERLEPVQIEGIQSLVAGSVEGLTAEKVTVIDQRGRVLSRGFADDTVGHSENQLALKKEVEGYLADKAQSMLAEVLGPGRAIVRVDATLNFEKLDREREVYDPEGAVVRSEERGETTDPDSGGGEETSVTNYEINRTVERIIGETSGIKSLSVAVFVDGRYVAPPEGGDAAYTPLGDEELTQLQRIVQTAVGLNAERGDEIEVVNMQFQGGNGAAGPAPAGLLEGPGWLDLVTMHGGRLLLFLIAAGLLLGLKRNLGRLLAESRPERPRDSPGTPAAGAETNLNLGTPAEPQAMSRMSDELREFAMANPEKVAAVVEAWISEEDGGR
jgi:flagellar M-ring protein FliF